MSSNPADRPNAVPGVPDMDRLVRYSHRGTGYALLIAALLFAVPALAMGYGYVATMARATRNCATNTYYSSPEACVAVQARGATQWLVLAAGCGLVAVVLGIGFVASRRRSSEFATVLASQPDRIAWMYAIHYAQKLTNQSVDRGVFLGLVDGRAVVLRVPDDADADRVLAAARALAPRATVGFSEGNQQRFAREPQSLLRAIA